MMLAEVLNHAGRPEEAIRLVEKAMRFNPRYLVWYLYVSGRSYYLTRRYEEAITALKALTARSPNLLIGHNILAATYSELGREAEARAEVAEVLRLSPNFSLEIGQQMFPFKDPAELERYLAALRKAGLK